MDAQYKSHNDTTFSYMEDTLRGFHAFKDVFLLGLAGKEAKAKANALGIELVKKPKVDEETHAETWKPSKKRREMSSWREYINHGTDVSKESDAYFNFPNIYLMSHWVK